MRNANAQVQLIDDLLDVSRIVTGKMRLDVRPVDLRRSSRRRSTPCARPPRPRTSGCRRCSTRRPSAITGDPDRLQQVVWNLLDQRGEVHADGAGASRSMLQRVNSHVEIIVSDTGQGIAPECCPHVFERFRQADSTSTRRHTGLGLGLALVRHLVELHGGTVEASSAGEGQGATFTVRLPVAIARADRRGRRGRARAPDGRDDRRRPRAHRCRACGSSSSTTTGTGSTWPRRS